MERLEQKTYTHREKNKKVNNNKHACPHLMSPLMVKPSMRTNKKLSTLMKKKTEQKHVFDQRLPIIAFNIYMKMFEK